MVPILDRPEGRPQPETAPYGTKWAPLFQSSIAPKGDRNQQQSQQSHPPKVPILDRPEGRPQLTSAEHLQAAQPVPILDRPEGRPQQILA